MANNFSYAQVMKNGTEQTLRAPNLKQLTAAVLAFRKQSKLPNADQTSVVRDIGRGGHTGQRARAHKSRRSIGIKDLLAAGRAAVNIVKGNVVSDKEIARRSAICMRCTMRLPASCKGFG